MTQPDITIIKKYVSNAALLNLIDLRNSQHTLQTLEQTRARAEQLAQVVNTEAHTRIDIHNSVPELWLLDPPAFLDKLARANLHLPSLVKVVKVAAMPRLAYSEYYGGMGLSTCTSGFSVRYAATGETGITTAGHCSDGQSVLATGRTYSYSGSLSFKWEYRPVGIRDIQWHTKIGVTARSFIYDGNSPTYRAIYGYVRRSSQSPGTFVCKYGKTTNYSCGTIITNAFDGVNVEVNMYPRVDSGDSGGPWFLDNNAYGTTISWTTSSNTSVYGPVDQILDQLGVQILTN